MDRWKYLILDMPMSGDTALLFPPHLQHAEVARAFGTSVPLAGGFVRWNSETQAFECHGQSDSLKLKPREGGMDNFLVNKVIKHG